MKSITFAVAFLLLASTAFASPMPPTEESGHQNMNDDVSNTDGSAPSLAHYHRLFESTDDVDTFELEWHGKNPMLNLEAPVLMPPLIAYHLDQKNAPKEHKQGGATIPKPASKEDKPALPPVWPPRNVKGKERAEIFSQMLETIDDLEQLTMWAYRSSQAPHGWHGECKTFFAVHVKLLNGEKLPGGLELTYGAKKSAFTRERECLGIMRLYLVTAYEYIGEVIGEVGHGVSPNKPVMYHYFRRSFSVQSLGFFLKSYMNMAENDYPEYEIDFRKERQITIQHIRSALLALEKELVAVISLVPGKFDLVTLRHPELKYEPNVKPGQDEMQEFRSTASMSVGDQWALIKILMSELETAFEEIGSTQFSELKVMGPKITFTVLADMIESFPEVRELYYRTQSRVFERINGSDGA